MLVRNGIVMRETAAAENVRGGYAAVYPALKTMEESGWIRRGMFVAGMGAAQFATRRPRWTCCAVCAWNRNARRPSTWRHPIPPIPTAACCRGCEGSTDHTMARAAGASVILVNGRLAAFFRRRNPALQVFLPDDEPERGKVARELAQKLAAVGHSQSDASAAAC